jgi:ABC-2 type transport system ATP-binding protein
MSHHSDMKYAIEVTNLKRVYKTYSKKEGVLESIKGLWSREYTEKVALQNINLQIEPGKIVGLIGSNGAGKTTLLKVLAGLIFPSEGHVSVLGFNPYERDYDYLKQMSLLLGQKNQLWWDISARDSYALLANIYDVNPNESKKRVAELANMLNCTHVLDTQLRRLSLGERMKMEIIGALLHHPKVLFLDEPTIGLDIVAQNAIRNFLEKYVKEYKPVVILTSHYMDDISELADNLLLISKGELVYNGTVDEFTAEAKIAKKIIYRYKNDTQERELIYETHELSSKLSDIMKQGEVTDLKTDEVDFEEVIHRFLAKESGLL